MFGDLVRLIAGNNNQVVLLQYLNPQISTVVLLYTIIMQVML